MWCDFAIADAGTRCSKCGYRLRRSHPTIPKRICGKASAPPIVVECVYQGEPFAGDDGGTATELVPWGGCGSVQGQRPTTVCACACPDNASGECLPYYRPCDRDRAAYAGRPWVCQGCPHRATPPA